ncbi:hypothetical protein CWI38_2007p0020 [Hamiltosporidium tvaerminnensis]|uniref:Uncharacterized protein n=1 Tax=Hamiltosporidium tvaerminnensis TaxID=1176355 RepID=A0A4Q9L9U8_9MICR|nr:hypothetical protein CWI37_0129p0010 [Hamiltosporidium tvaerminnensis]TBU10121.1 hypothetical protein CWI38_2007p0020 [Hamiltosporidium tvaerminnensis]
MGSVESTLNKKYPLKYEKKQENGNICAKYEQRIRDIKTQINSRNRNDSSLIHDEKTYIKLLKEVQSSL